MLSLALFNVYVDDLSKLLSKCRKECNINDVYVNHIMYADDNVLIAPSPHALQVLIYECELFAKDNDIIFNAQKSKLMCINDFNYMLNKDNMVSPGYSDWSLVRFR